MNDSTTRAPWTPPLTAKAKGAVQRAVTAVLNELAPEREVKRASPVATRIETHRSPTGCVLQAATAAISVSWFASRDSAAGHGELQITVWRGIVAQRGANQERKGATIVAEQTVMPFTPSEGECVWRLADGAQCDSVALAARCMALLEGELRRLEVTSA